MLATAVARGEDLDARKYLMAVNVTVSRPTHALKAAPSNFTLDHLALPFDLLQEFCPALDIPFRDRTSDELVEGVLIVVVAVRLQFRICRASPGNEGGRYVYLIIVV